MTHEKCEMCGEEGFLKVSKFTFDIYRDVIVIKHCKSHSPQDVNNFVLKPGIKKTLTLR